jgi:uncharacterized glyoxalase superfamily protein PhnB
MASKPIPEGYRSVTPYLLVPNVPKLIEFLKNAFGAEEAYPPFAGPDGRIMHAEVKVGDSILMMGEPMGEFGPMPASLYLYVSDTDATYQSALKAGATSVMEPANQFYGDRSAGVKDPTGNVWWIATHVEDVPPEELSKRAEAAMKERAG